MFLDEEFLEFEDNITLDENAASEWFAFYFKGYSEDVDKRIKESLENKINTKEDADKLLEDINGVLASTSVDIKGSANQKNFYDKRGIQELIVDIVGIFFISPLPILTKTIIKFASKDLLKARAKSRKLALKAKEQIEEIKKENGWS